MAAMLYNSQLFHVSGEAGLSCGDAGTLERIAQFRLRAVRLRPNQAQQLFLSQVLLHFRLAYALYLHN
jgi:hypothetical protein